MAEPELKTTLTEWAEEAFSREDLFVLEVDIRGFEGSRTITIYVDGDEGVSLDECTKISRGISSRLEEEDIIKGKFNLRVSSPGAERSLLMPRQYVKHLGRELECVVETSEGEEKMKGILKIADNEKVILESSKGDSYTIAHEKIIKAKILLPW